jgi:tetratricopeptide (TPR) repeat protein
MTEELQNFDELSSIIEQADLLVNDEKLDQANELYNKALELCTENDGIIRATLLYKIGLNLANLSKYDDAMQIWDQALRILDKNDDIHGKGLMLHNIATTMASRGNISFATKLWKQSFDVKEKAGDLAGMAATLLNLAWVANNEQDLEREIKLIHQAIYLLSKVNAWPELIASLQKLSFVDSKNTVSTLAQAFWLSIHEDIESDIVFFIASDLLKNIGLESKYAPIIAAGAMFLINSRSQNHPHKEQIQNATKEMLAACAIVSEIPENKITDWINEKELDDPNKIFSGLQIALNEIVGENNWFFDRNVFKQGY